jgi:ketosteroid isomerase-like protein
LTTQSAETEAILNHHLQALMARDVEEALADYNDDSVILTQQGPVTGIEAFRALFTGALRDIFTEEALKNFKMTRQDVAGDVAYIVWEMPGVPLGTDTFVIRNSKIVSQTFAMHSA